MFVEVPKIMNSAYVRSKISGYYHDTRGSGNDPSDADDVEATF